jgi:type I restriction enzyme S subunit
VTILGNDNWLEVEIGEIVQIIGGATPDASDAANFDDADGIPWHTPKDLSKYTEKYISRGERNLTPKGLSKCACRILPQGTVLFSSRAPIGYVAIASRAARETTGGIPSSS